MKNEGRYEAIKQGRNQYKSSTPETEAAEIDNYASMMRKRFQGGQATRQQLEAMTAQAAAKLAAVEAGEFMDDVRFTVLMRQFKAAEIVLAEVK